MSQIGETKNRKFNILKIVGIALLIIGVVFLLSVYIPVIQAYIKYRLTDTDKVRKVYISTNENPVNTEITDDTTNIFIDQDFGIYIPKILTNAKIIPNVDTSNTKEYLEALKKGIAHAKNSSLPNQKGNVFLFSHSAVNFYNNDKYAVYFYLLGELKKDDPIYVSYEQQIYKYKVLVTKIVDKTDTKYINKYMDEDTLTLMTCWPSGTNLKRLIVISVRDTSE